MKRVLKIVLPVFLVTIMVLIGILLKGGVVGIFTLVLGVMNVYFTSHGKWYSYIFGILYTVVSTVIYYNNGQYGAVIMNVFCFEPILITGLINWLKHKTSDSVLTKSLDKGKRIKVILIIIASSVLMGLLLSLIKTENGAFLDSFSQMLNVAANILLMLRYKECWSIWVIGGIVEITLWIRINIIGGENAVIMLINSFIYFSMSIYGYINWCKIEKNQQKINTAKE